MRHLRKVKSGGLWEDFLLSTKVMIKIQRSEWLTSWPGIRRWLIYLTRGRTQTKNIIHRKYNWGRQTSNYKHAAQMPGNTVFRVGLHSQREMGWLPMWKTAIIHHSEEKQEGRQASSWGPERVEAFCEPQYGPCRKGMIMICWLFMPCAGMEQYY